MLNKFQGLHCHIGLLCRRAGEGHCPEVPALGIHTGKEDVRDEDHPVTGFLEQFLVDPSGEDVPAQADDQPFFLFRRVKKAAFEYSVMILIVRSNFS